MGSQEQQRDVVTHVWEAEGKEYLWVRGCCEHCALDTDESTHGLCFNHPNRTSSMSKLVISDCPEGYCWIENKPEAIANYIAGIMSDE